MLGSNISKALQPEIISQHYFNQTQLIALKFNTVVVVEVNKIDYIKIFPA